LSAHVLLRMPGRVGRGAAVYYKPGLREGEKVDSRGQ
jgi:hypothetical protein